MSVWVTTETKTLKIDNKFVDGDTRTITLKNPKDNITTAMVTNLQTFQRTNNIIIGDKAGATFGSIDKVSRVTTTKYVIDNTID